MMNSYIPTQEVEYVPFWRRTFLFFPYWLIALILLVLVLYWLYKHNHLTSLGLSETGTKGTYSFVQQPLPSTVSPVSPVVFSRT